MAVMEVGCYIDCSHLPAYYFDMRVIDFARANGWDCGTWDYDIVLQDFNRFDDLSDEDQYKFVETLYYVADDALDWLNANLAEDDKYFVVSDNSLYLEGGDDTVNHIYAYEVDSDGRGPNVWEFVVGDTWIATVTHGLHEFIISHYRDAGVMVEIHTIDEYYDQEA